jgi:hypothetical protein
MRGVRKLLLVLALVALMATGLAACGGGDGDDSISSSNPAPAQEKTATAPQRSTPEDSAKQGSGKDSSTDEGSASFRTQGGDNSIQDYGGEADRAEIDAATAVLRSYLDARASADFAKQCVYLAKGTVAPLEEFAKRSSQLKGKGCAEILSALVSNASTAALTNTLTGDLASLRIEGKRGFALYHGDEDVDYFVPMVKEGGEWKVAALSPSEFP